MGKDAGSIEGAAAARAAGPPWVGLGLVAICIAAAAVGVRGVLGDELDPKRALSLLRSVEHHGWAVALFLLAYVGLTAAFVPAVLFHLISGAAWGFKTGLLLNLCAFNVAATAQFWAARLLGRGKLAPLWRRYGLQRFDDAAVRQGLRATLAVRALPLPTMVVNAAAGVSGMRWRDFALGSLLGGMPAIGIYTYFASALVEGMAGAEERALVQTLLAGALVLALTILPRLIVRVRAQRGQTP